MFDVVIIGASVAGNRTAELIAKAGYKVLLIEQHKEIGQPCKCTGLVSWRLLELLPDLPKKIIINKIKTAKFFSPNGNFFSLKSKKEAYVIDRPELDKFLFYKAKKAGAKIKIAEMFMDFSYTNEGIEIKTNKGNYKTKILIGTDGANSLVAKQAKIEQPKKFLVGLQATANGDFDSHSVELWFGSVCPKFFAWVVPESESTARIGLATNKTPNKFYEKFLRKRIGSIEEPDVSGIIKFGLMKRAVANRLLLVGDAACQMKPFSGGGIVYGLIASEIAAHACLKALKENKFTKNFFKKYYDEKWKEKLEKPIKRGLLYRKIMNLFPDFGINTFFSLIKKLGRKKLEKFDMDLLE